MAQILELDKVKDTAMDLAKSIQFFKLCNFIEYRERIVVLKTLRFSPIYFLNNFYNERYI